MAKRMLTDAEIAALPPQRRRETLKKRAYRARKAAEAGKPVAITPSPSPEQPKAGDPAAVIYAKTKAALQDAGLWRDEAMSGLLTTYAKCTALIESAEIGMVAPSVLMGQSRAAAALGLDRLPAERRTPRQSLHVRLGLDRDW